MNFKTALLRDLCRALGIQVVLDPSRKLLLGNKIKPMEGRSLVPAFDGKPIERPEGIYWEHEGNRAVRKGD